MNIYERINTIAKEVGAIGKSQKNEGQNFDFRGIEDIYNRLSPLLAKHGVFSAPLAQEMNREDGKTSTGKPQCRVWGVVKYKFYDTTGESFECGVMTEAVDSGDKAASKAMAIAHKYALCQVFTLPYKDMDPDAYSPQWVTEEKGTITPTQHRKLKAKWWQTVKGELSGVEDELRKEAFAKWVAVSTGVEFDVSNWRKWSQEDLHKCEAMLESTESKDA